MRTLIALAALTALTACVEELDCTALAASSVQLTVLDADGAIVPTATASYTVDGEAPVDCDGAGDQLICGWEVEGDLLIEVHAEGYESASQQVTVASDECHVITEFVEVTLQTAAD